MLKLKTVIKHRTAYQSAKAKKAHLTDKWGTDMFQRLSCRVALSGSYVRMVSKGWTFVNACDKTAQISCKTAQKTTRRTCFEVWRVAFSYLFFFRLFCKINKAADEESVKAATQIAE